MPMGMMDDGMAPPMAGDMGMGGMGEMDNEQIGEILRQLFQMLVDRGVVSPDAMMPTMGTGMEFDPMVEQMAMMGAPGDEVPPMVGGTPPATPMDEPYPDDIGLFDEEDEMAYRRRIMG